MMNGSRGQGAEYPVTNRTGALEKVKENSSARRGLRRAANVLNARLKIRPCLWLRLQDSGHDARRTGAGVREVSELRADEIDDEIDGCGLTVLGQRDCHGSSFCVTACAVPTVE
jgi:hypothetical protein